MLKINDIREQTIKGPLKALQSGKLPIKAQSYLNLIARGLEDFKRMINDDHLYT